MPQTAAPWAKNPSAETTTTTTRATELPQGSGGPPLTPWANRGPSVPAPGVAGGTQAPWATTGIKSNSGASMPTRVPWAKPSEHGE
jgi:hypothetical protein